MLLLLPTSERCAQRLSEPPPVCHGGKSVVPGTRTAAEAAAGDSHRRVGGKDVLAAGSRCSFVEEAACRNARLGLDMFMGDDGSGWSTRVSLVVVGLILLLRGGVAAVAAAAAAAAVAGIRRHVGTRG